MILGPEFQRHLWTRFSPFSLAFMPVLVGAILILFYMLSLVGDSAASTVNAVFQSSLAFEKHWSAKSLFIFVPGLFISLYILGTYEASSSFTAELKNKTWDLQKTSSIRPIELVVGKLFGVTSYSWYMSFGFLLATLYGYMNMSGNQGGVLVYPTLADAVLLVFTIVSSALVAHIGAALFSIQNLSNKKTGGFAPLLLGLIAGWVCFSTLASILDITFFSNPGALTYIKTINWFEFNVEKKTFAILSLLFFVFWAVIALHRIVRAELNFQSFPFVWIGFLATLSIYIVGLLLGRISTGKSGFGDGVALAYLVPALMIFLMATYSGLYRASSDLTVYQRLFASFKQKRYKRILETVPDWIPTLLVVIVLSVITLGVIWSLASNNAANMEVTNAFGLSSLLLSVILFIVRDGIVMHICLLGNRFKRGGLMIAAYYLFAYFLLPSLVFVSDELSWGNVQQMFEFYDADYPKRYLLCMFTPMYQEDMFAALLPVIIQVSVFGYILKRTIFKHVQEGRIQN